MNSLASLECGFSKCVVRLLSSLVAVAGLFFAIACNSGSGITPPNNEGYGNGNLSGTYVFSSTGVDSGGVFLAVAGAFTADGSGNVSGGNIDVNGFDVGQSSTPITAASGAYSIGTDGRGHVTLSTSGGVLSGVTLDFVLTSSSHGLVTEFDGQGTGSGTIDLQNLGSLTGSYSFGLSGATSSGTPIAAVGSFASGGSIAGLIDINSNNTAFTDLALSGTVSGGSPGTAALTSNAGTYNFDVYMVDATHLKFIETDAAQIMAGDAFTQQNSLPSAAYAYTMEGLDATSSPLALAGFFSSDGSATISSGLEDYNDAGVLASTMPAVSNVSGSFTSFSGGRTQLTLNSIYNGVSGVLSNVTFAAYPSSGGVQLLEIDGAGITGGVALSQGSSGTLPAQGYGLNLTAINGGSGNGIFEEDDIAQFDLNSSNSFHGAEDVNDQGSTSYGTAFNGSLTSNSAAPGYGSVLMSTPNNLQSFNYYIANGGATTLILETDGDQLGVGIFEPQTSPQSPASAAVSHFSPVHFKPSVKGAWKKRQQ